jgi:hypothetical protein
VSKVAEPIEEDGSARSGIVQINHISDDLRASTLEFLYTYVNEGINEIKMQEGIKIRNGLKIRII